MHRSHVVGRVPSLAGLGVNGTQHVERITSNGFENSRGSTPGPEASASDRVVPATSVATQALPPSLRAEADESC